MDDLKRAAAERAAEWIRDGMVLGLGTGSTVRHLLDLIAERRSQGEWRAVRGIPTSEDTRARASALGIPLTTLAEDPAPALTIDGADEVDPALDLVKGLGGALLREKIVANASHRVVIVVDESKEVVRLGTRAPLPVEVDPFGWTGAEGYLRGLGCEPSLRRDERGEAVVTDGGHLLLDCAFPDGIEDPAGWQRRMRRWPGVLETGLFLGLADAVVVAGSGAVRVRERAESRVR